MIKKYEPDLKLKKPSEFAKVEILEEVIKKGTLENLKDVLNTYKEFEITARALGLAARYRGIDFVHELVEHGATFNYAFDSNLKRKYNAYQTTVSNYIKTEYYLMLVQKKLDLGKMPGFNQYCYDYSPMYGVSYMNIPEELEENALPLKDRIDIAKYVVSKKELGASIVVMTKWAPEHYELDFADAMIDIYTDIVADELETIDWNTIGFSYCGLKSEQLLPVLERLDKLQNASGKKLVFHLTDHWLKFAWNDDSFLFFLERTDMNVRNKKQFLEFLISKNFVKSLEKIATTGLLDQRGRREGLIEYARENGFTESHAWLMDFKNRTVDIVAEEEKETAQTIRELNAAPNTTFVLRKEWSYKKLEDGSLSITSYKGNNIEVEIPSAIGKAKVTSIGELAFTPLRDGIKNEDIRKKIKSVTIPEGVTEIGENAFLACESIEIINLPSSIKQIGKSAFKRCKKLKKISIPEGVNVNRDVFSECVSLCKSNGFVILDNVLYYHHHNSNKKSTTLIIPDCVRKISPFAFYFEKSASIYKNSNSRTMHIKEIVLPEGLIEIGEGAFENLKFEKITIPSSVKKIDKNAFRYCTSLRNVKLSEGLELIGESAFERTAIEEIRIPKSLRELPSRAFFGCSVLKDVYIPSTVKKIGKQLFGEKEGWYGVEVTHVHTPIGSAAERYMKKLDNVCISNDYTD